MTTPPKETYSNKSRGQEDCRYQSYQLHRSCILSRLVRQLFYKFVFLNTLLSNVVNGSIYSTTTFCSADV
jgi:hypothetical protein